MLTDIEIAQKNEMLPIVEVAKKIENEMEYPGQIKINVVRESRVVDYAK